MTTGNPHLAALESRSIYILREAYAHFPQLAMLWSIGKDSTVLLWLARKAFFGHVPFPLIHIDTSFKIPEMISYRDQLTRDWRLNMIIGQNQEALSTKDNYPQGALNRLDCCKKLKTEALENTLKGLGERKRFNHESGCYEVDPSSQAYTGVIVGVRADEEGSRSKERYFSGRDEQSRWELENQPPEFWNQYKTDYAPGTQVRIHPLLDWTEVNIWEYIHEESIPTVSLYYDQGDHRRYRSLGCAPCTEPIESHAQNPEEIIQELKVGPLKNVAERSGRAQDREGSGGLEDLRREGYM